MKRLLSMMLMLTMLTALCAQTAFAVNDVEETGAALEAVSLAEVDEVLQAGVARVMPMDFRKTATLTVKSDDKKISGEVVFQIIIEGQIDIQRDIIMDMDVTVREKSTSGDVTYDVDTSYYDRDDMVYCNVYGSAKFRDGSRSTTVYFDKDYNFSANDYT